MKRYVIRLLVLANMALTIGLVSLWIDRDGQVQNIHWQAPAPIKVEIRGIPSALTSVADSAESHFVATLERPLFAPNRRPPPPPAPPAPEPPPDPLANIQLYGVFSGEGVKGILARIDGKVRRVFVNDLVGDWSVKEINDRDVSFTRADETRVLRLVQVRTPVPQVPSVAGAGNAYTGNPAAAGVPGGLAAAQKIEEEGRDRLRRRNAIRATAGLPPLTQ